MRLSGALSRRDTYLCAAGATLAVSYLLGVAASIDSFTSAWPSWAAFFSRRLLAASAVLPTCGQALLAVGFAVGAVAFFGSVTGRGRRLGLGALVVAGGYLLVLVGGALSLVSFFRNQDQPLPAGLEISIVMQVVAYLPALVATLLAATAFGRLRAAPGVEGAARNRRLGWASIGFGVGYALLLLSRLLTRSPAWAVLDLWDAAYLAALAAAVVASAGFFIAAREHARREGFLAIAATLYLLYRVLELTQLLDATLWLGRVEALTLTLAALFASIGFVVSRRSFLDSDAVRVVQGNG